jgi:hypothetical protein
MVCIFTLLGLSYRNTSKAWSFLHSQEKTCCNLEIDSEIPFSKDINEKKENFKIHNSR